MVEREKAVPRRTTLGSNGSSPTILIFPPVSFIENPIGSNNFSRCSSGSNLKSQLYPTTPKKYLLTPWDE
jgi:hypothetical protein